MMSSRGMGAISPSKQPKMARRKAEMYAEGGGLYANIHAKRKRIAQGSGEKMRAAGKPGAPTAKAFKQSALTAK